MKSHKFLLGSLVVLSALGFGVRPVHSQEKTGAASTVQVHMVITDEAVRDDSEVPILRPENVQVKQGKTSLKVDHLIPARGGRRWWRQRTVLLCVSIPRAEVRVGELDL
jgi:hypothetical protein